MLRMYKITLHSLTDGCNLKNIKKNHKMTCKLVLNMGFYKTPKYLALAYCYVVGGEENAIAWWKDGESLQNIWEANL